MLGSEGPRVGNLWGIEELLPSAMEGDGGQLLRPVEGFGGTEDECWRSMALDSSYGSDGPDGFGSPATLARELLRSVDRQRFEAHRHEALRWGWVEDPLDGAFIATSPGADGTWASLLSPPEEDEKESPVAFSPLVVPRLPSVSIDMDLED
jgi:hypothetical protein